MFNSDQKVKFINVNILKGRWSLKISFKEWLENETEQLKVKLLVFDFKMKKEQLKIKFKYFEREQVENETWKLFLHKYFEKKIEEAQKALYRNNIKIKISRPSQLHFISFTIVVIPLSLE